MINGGILAVAFEQIVGNEKVKQLLKSTIEKENILHSYLFVGIEGIGKQLFAKEFAQMIFCQNQTQKPCHKCKACSQMESGNHPDFLQINSEDGKSIKIEQIRYLQEEIAQKPVASSKKVYIINDSDLMTREASNCLLKTLEEPPEYATIILITASESKLLTTIQSRCMKINFEPIQEEQMKQYLKKNNFDTDIEATTGILRFCGGSIGKALKLQDQKEEYQAIEKLVHFIPNTSITNLWKNAEILYKAKENVLELLDDMILFYAEQVKKDGRQENVKAVSILEETKRKILANANYDMSIDSLLLKLWEELA